MWKGFSKYYYKQQSINTLILKMIYLGNEYEIAIK